MAEPADNDADDGLTGDEKIHAEALEVFDRCVENEADNRKEAKDDLRFARLGEQWPAQARKIREADGRPCLTSNLMPAFIRQVVNDARQNKPAIVVHPADDNADPETAEVMMGLIRNIEASSASEVAYDTSLDFAVSCGFGYFRINTQYSSDDTFEQDLVIEQIADPFTVYGDPYDNGPDSANWNHAFVVEAMPKEEFEAEYKGSEPVDWESGDYANLTEHWRDGDRVVVAEYWRREVVTREIVALSNGEVVGLDEYQAQKADFDAAGVQVVGKPRPVKSHKVCQYIMSGAEILDKVEWAGRYIPIVPVYGEDLMVEGKRYLRSMVRDAKDAQRQRNYHLSAVTELVALAPKAPFIGKKGTFKTDQAKWETANTETHAYLEYDHEKPERQPFAGVPAGEMQQVLMAHDDMKAIMGLHDASLGAKSNETSGRAIVARQREGDVSTFNFIDNLSRAIRHAGRILLDLIPSVYGVSRMVRVMGQDGVASKVRVGPQGEVPVAAQQGPEAPEGALRVYDLTVGKYDLVVKTGPSFSTRREEAAEQMVELMRAMPQAAPVIGDLLAKNLDWPGADEVAKRLHALLPPNVQAAIADDGKGVPVPQVQAMQQQARQAVGQLQQQLQQVTQALEAMKQDKELEAQKLQLEGYKAETERITAEAEARRALIVPDLASATTP